MKINETFLENKMKLLKGDLAVLLGCASPHHQPSEASDIGLGPNS